jgi:hypothetical protein
MTAQLSAREALFVESLGEMADLVIRVEALMPLLQDTRQSLIEANTQLSHQLVAFEDRTTALAEHTKVVAVKHIAQRTDEMTRRSVQIHVQEIRDAARTALGAEIRPTLQELVAPLQRLAHLATQREHPWERWQRWAEHVATAAIASVVTLGLAAWLWPR